MFNHLFVLQSKVQDTASVSTHEKTIKNSMRHPGRKYVNISQMLVAREFAGK